MLALICNKEGQLPHLYDKIRTTIHLFYQLMLLHTYLGEKNHHDTQNNKTLYFRRHLAEKERFVAIAKLQPRLYGDEITAANLFAMLVDSTLSCTR